MRVTTSSIFQGIYNSTTNELKSIQELQKRSTVKLLSAADDPAGYQMVSRVEGKLDGLSAFDTNMSTSKAALSDMDTSLKQIIEALGDADTTVARDSNGTWGEDDLRLMANDINSILEHMVDRINSGNSVGEYTFSGSNGKQAPYEVVRDGNGKITDMIYQGDDAAKNVKISPSQSVATTANGEGVFGPDGDSLFSLLIDIRDQMEAGTFDSPVGVNFAQQIGDQQEHLIFQRSKAGVETNRIEKLEHFNSSMKDNYTDILVRTKDADFTEVATQLMLHQTALQMSAQLGRVLNGMVFVDFN